MDLYTDEKPIVFFDIDNTLYSASTKIAEAMAKRIHGLSTLDPPSPRRPSSESLPHTEYFMSLGHNHEEAADLHLQYYTKYGLALRGLTLHDNVDPLDFDAKCDGALPLDEMLKPNPALRQLLQDIDRSKVRVWALTNAYRTHAARVLKILNLEDEFEGVIYCDYAEPGFYCKPEPEYYHLALRKAGVSDPAKVSFVDDNRGNIEGARRLGWGRCVHFCEFGLETVEGGKVKKLGEAHELEAGLKEDVPVIGSLQQLREMWPDIFKKQS
ncbi:hypothetical protein EWM64_g69 [Hericium alpestre]|uniref:Pyrimidine 5-nucleotidase n=1 Tax=Hericium alpestre TaxID=135208 RepID=A0A4Z0AAZ9_9AGAM|nr:hypothetical protein EWM64_g69 [Hericium alpestre]